MRKGDPVFAWKLRMGARHGARSERNAPAEGGYEVWSTARECVVVTVICLSRARLTSAVCTLCMAGRRLEVREVSYIFSGNGSATAPGSWVPNSDGRLKFDIKRIEDPLGKMVKLRGVTWQRLDGLAPGIGFIAQEVQEVFPEFVFEGSDRTLEDGTVVEKVLSPDTYGVAAALHHEAILALMQEVQDLKKKVAELHSGS